MKRVFAALVFCALCCLQASAAFFSSESYRYSNLTIGPLTNCNYNIDGFRSLAWPLAPAQGAAPLDATHIAFIFGGPGGSQIAILSVDPDTGLFTCGSPVVFGTTGYDVAPTWPETQFIALSTTEVVLTYTDTSNSNRISIVGCSVSGLTIACSSPATPGNASSTFYTQPVALDSSHVVMVFNNADVADVAVACSLSGSSTPSCGSPVNLLASTTSDSGIYGIVNLTSTTALVVTADSGNSNIMTHEVLTISGTAITFGTPVTLPGSHGLDMFSAFPSGLPINVGTFDSAHVSILERDQNLGGVIYAASISGTTVTLGSPVALGGAPDAWSSVLSSTTVAYNTNNATVGACTLTPPTSLSCVPEQSVSFASGQSISAVGNGTDAVLGNVELKMALLRYVDGVMHIFPTLRTEDYPIAEQVTFAATYQLLCSNSNPANFALLRIPQ